MFYVEGRLNGSWVPKVDFYSLRPMIREFIKKYKDKYPEGFLDEDDLFRKIGSFLITMEYFQIYSYLGFIDDKDNIYYGYYKKLAELFDINCDIFDAASGFIAAFGLIVASMQLRLPNSKGTVSVCDTSLIFDKSRQSNMTLIKDRFTSSFDLSKYDLVTGIMPCPITKDIIKAACEQDKDFYIGLCNCEANDHPKLLAKSQLDDNIEYAEEMCSKFDRELHKTFLDPSYNVKLPIIYSKKRKHC